MNRITKNIVTVAIAFMLILIVVLGSHLLPSTTTTSNTTTTTIITNTTTITTTTTTTNTSVIVHDPTFGVVAQYYLDAELKAYTPDLWTLVDYVGASCISSTPRREWADEAASRGIKIMFTFGIATTPKTMMDAYKSKEALKAHLDIYNISQYRDHPGVWGYVICGEPFNNWDSQTDQLVEVIRYGCQYVKSLDPTHPVTVALNPAGAYYEDPNGTYIEKRKEWIERFIDVIDVLDYHYYRFTATGTDGGSGSEFWRDKDAFRKSLIRQLDEVLIPAARGKPIIIGETGCPVGNPATESGAVFTEQDQTEYFRIFGEETKKRGIFVYMFKLIDADSSWPYDKFGLFKTQNDGTMNIPRLSAFVVRDYLSLTTSSDALMAKSSPEAVQFIIDEFSYATPWTSTIQEGTYMVNVPSKVQVARLMRSPKLARALSFYNPSNTSLSLTKIFHNLNSIPSYTGERQYRWERIYS